MMEKLENVLLRKTVPVVIYFKMYFISTSFFLGRKLKKLSEA